MVTNNKIRNPHGYKTPNACPICGNEVPVKDLFCEKCGMRIHTHQLQDKVNEYNYQNRPDATRENMHHTPKTTYGLHKLSENPELRAIIERSKASLRDPSFDLKCEIDDFLKRAYESIKDIIVGDIIDGNIFEKLGQRFVEERDFGLDRCTEAAKEIFNLGIFMTWTNLSSKQKKELAGAYAKEVADAFDLIYYKGVVFEDLELNVLGYSNGDGSIHLSNCLVAERTSKKSTREDYAFKYSAFQIIDTITHELRHQYQFETIRGYHKVADDVIKEWTMADHIYNRADSSCYDPWGYNYNPLEIDARYAGETVVRNITHDWFNTKCTKTGTAINRNELEIRLIHEGYNDVNILDKTIDNLLKLDGDALEMLNSWLKRGTLPQFDNIEGISSSFLRERLKMKEPAIILSYGMLMNNPKINGNYLKGLSHCQTKPHHV